MEENKELMVNDVEETNDYEVLETKSNGKFGLVAAGAAALAGLAAFGVKKLIDKRKAKKSEVEPEVVEEVNEDSNEESK